MANTFTQYIQFIFAVKKRESLIQQIWKNELYKYITGVVQNKGNKMLAINGMSDHIHIFVGYKPIVSITDLVKDIKIASNEWINEKKLSKYKFAWQGGYGAFSYGRSQVDDVCKYITNQEQHHKKKSFRQEYLGFLKQFEIEYDKKYLFEFFDDLYSTPTGSLVSL